VGGYVSRTNVVIGRSNLDTVASSARRMFLCECVVQGRSKTRHLAVNVKTKKRQKRLNSQRSELVTTSVYGVAWLASLAHLVNSVDERKTLVAVVASV